MQVQAPAVRAPQTSDFPSFPVVQHGAKLLRNKERRMLGAVM
jgi:hypothetical protein